MQNLEKYVHYPSADNALALAKDYEAVGQYAAAITYYLEAAAEENLAYYSLLKVALLFKLQGDRKATVTSTLKKAFAANPLNAQEALYHLARIANDDGDYLTGYMYCKLLDGNSSYPNIELDFPGSFGILFERGRAAWWLGYFEESRQDMYNVYKHSNDRILNKAALNNLRSIGYPDSCNKYFRGTQKTKFKWDKGRFSSIYRSYGQVSQDMFAAAVNDFKLRGTYLEIGAADPVYSNNTFMLEKDLNWTGKSIEINQGLAAQFNLQRKNECINADALTVDYANLCNIISPNKVIDYLQVDCEPSHVSLNILDKVIKTSGCIFNAITFEHDAYLGGTAKERSRELLNSHGYILAVPNVHFDSEGNFEDWWIHPSALTDYSMISTNKERNTYQSYFLGK